METKNVFINEFMKALCDMLKLRHRFIIAGLSVLAALAFILIDKCFK